MTAVLERPDTVPEAVIEEARSRQRQRRARFGFLVLLVGSVVALPVVAGGGSGRGAERFGDRFGPMGQRLTTVPGAPLHTLTSVVLVGFRNIDVDPRTGQVDASGRKGKNRLVSTFRAMLTSRSIVRRAIARSGVRRSVGDVVLATTATTPPDLIEISVTDRRAETARRLADAIAEVFVEQVNSSEPAGARAVQVTSAYEHARESP